MTRLSFSRAKRGLCHHQPIFDPLGAGCLLPPVFKERPATPHHSGFMRARGVVGERRRVAESSCDRFAYLGSGLATASRTQCAGGPPCSFLTENDSSRLA